METSKTLSEKLAEVYLYEQTYHKEKMYGDEAVRYYDWILSHGQCITVTDGETLAGYVEFYRNNEKCYIRDLYIRPKYRHGEVLPMLKKRLFEVCKGVKEIEGRRDKRDRIERRILNGRW